MLNNKEDAGTVEGSAKPRYGLDMILTEELGQLGMFQLRNVAYSVVVCITIGWTLNEYIFTAARISTRCVIPECESTPPEFSQPWLEHALPATGDSFDNCQRFANSSSGADLTGTCPADLFDTTTLLDCDGYVYENTDTVVYDYDLGCKDWLRSIIGSVRKLGSLTALPITGYISDRWGRRTALVFNAVNSFWLGTIRYWADSYIAYIISVFIESNFGSALYSCVYILTLELVGPKYRVIVGVTVKTGYAVGQVTLAAIAWAVPSWRRLTLAIYLPQVVSLGYYWIFSESILWYLNQGSFKKSETSLHKIALINGKMLSQTSVDALRMAAEQEKKNKVLQKELEANEPWLIVQVFTHKKVLIRCLVTPVWWVTGTLIYYGMTINAVNLSGNRYLNYAAVAAAEVPGFWTAALLLDRLGRKPVFIAAYWLCAACQFAYVFTPTNLYALSLTMFLIGNYCIAIVMTVVYVYTAELYPTQYRHRLFAFSSMVGRIGAVIAPLTPTIAAAVWDKLPFAIFGSLALLSGMLVFLMPETLGSKLPDTMADAELIGNHNT